jgi:hypothetical protein
MAFQPGNTHGVTTRFKPGTSGNPGGRPRGLSAIAHAQLEEAAAGGDQTKAEEIVRKLIDMAVGGNVQAMKLVLEREWPAPNRHEIAGADGEAIRLQVEEAAREFDRLLGIERPPEADASVN